MNRQEKIVIGVLWLMALMLLAACGTTPAPKVDDAAATKIVATFMAQITQTAAAGDLPATMEPTEPEAPEDDETPVATATPESYKTLLDKFRTVTLIKGNLYVRDGTGLPVQITKSGKDHDPVISADGQKIAFYRGEKFDNVFIINADGSGEKQLVNAKLLPEITDGMVKFLTFRPGTSDLLFSSYFCKSSVCGASIFIANTESAKITKLVSGLTAPASTIPNFASSPDGQYLSVAAPKQMDLYRLTDSKLVQANILNVAPGKNSLPLQYWLPDSSGLIVFAQDAIWRYSLPENQSEKLLLEQSKSFACGLSISSDRNWIFYQESGLLVSLKDSQTQVYTWSTGCVVKWSSDSQHFASQTAIGSVDGTPPISIDGHFITWLDATHYLFSKGKNLLDLQSYIAEVGKEADAVQTNFIWSPVYAVLP